MDVLLGLLRYVFLILITLFFSYILFTLNRNMSFRVDSGKKRRGAYLQVLSGENYLKLEKGYRHFLGDVCNIGRSPENDIVIDDPYASGRNTVIERKKKKYYVSDLQSRNGTLLNGITVTSGAPMEQGDTLQVGEVSFLFDIE